MSKPTMDLAFGRRAFGDNPAHYNASRPRYVDAVWHALRQRANLRIGAEILEIGAGAGLATKQLLEHQPGRLVVVEPDPRSTEFMRREIADPRLEILTLPFEDVDLAPSSFDLVACATAFHWLDAVPSLKKIKTLLKPSGRLALWWNVFGDNTRPDPFHIATAHLLSSHKESRTSGRADQLSHALDVTARLQDFTDAGFIADEPETLHWVMPLDAKGVRNLYSTFSSVQIRKEDERLALLDALEEIAIRDFGGHVERNMTTAIYTAS